MGRHQGNWARARELYETTDLPIKVIGARTGVDVSNISTKAKKDGWWAPHRKTGIRHTPKLYNVDGEL